MLRLPNGAGPCHRTTHLIVIVQKVTGMTVSRTMKQTQHRKLMSFWMVLERVYSEINPLLVLVSCLFYVDN
jgi:hypothetical protein